MLTLILILCGIYFLLYKYLPILLLYDKEMHTNGVSNEVYPSQKVAIPSYQWREVPISVRVAFPFFRVSIWKYTFNLVGKIGCRLYSMPDCIAHGLYIIPQVFEADPDKEIVLYAINFNPRGPFIARPEAPIAYLEFYRIPKFITIKMTR